MAIHNLEKQSVVDDDDDDDRNDDVVNADDDDDDGGNEEGTESFGNNDEVYNMPYTKKVAMRFQALNLDSLITFVSKF